MRPFLRRIFKGLSQPGAPDVVDPRAVRHILSSCRELLSERGEVSGARLATDVLTAYRALTPAARDLFMDVLVGDFSADPTAVDRAVDLYRGNPVPATLRHLQNALESPRQELFRRLNLAPDGIAGLIDIRRQLLATLHDHPERETIDHDLVHLFKSWFNGGFLVLQRIDWRTSAVVLERLIQYEAVHQIQGWRDLHRRLEADRGCYALFHPALPEEPLIFIEVALTRGMSAKVQPLLDPESSIVDPAVANSAIFYSITNCQEGLRGISFGNLLIKQVVEDLRKRFPRLRTFATLSPIPGFSTWLAELRETDTRSRLSSALVDVLEGADVNRSMEAMIASSSLRQEISSLCAYYLIHAKQGMAPLDSVARFHLANGASLERLNWLGDTSAQGIRRSLGLMANYRYKLTDIERNHEAYANKYRIVVSRELARLARQSPLPLPTPGAART